MEKEQGFYFIVSELKKFTEMFKNFNDVYTKAHTLLAPVITSSGTTAAITAASGAEIRYTTDGSTPTRASSLYSSGITVTTGTVVKAIAYKDGFVESEVSSHTC